MARVFLGVFGLVDDGFDVQRTAINAVRAGYAVVLVEPGGKAPKCTYTSRQIREHGRDHPCGISHAIRDHDEAKKVFERATKNGVEVNLGVVAGLSHLVVVDADTATEVAAFQSDWAAADGPQFSAAQPTVWTPGAKNDDDTWRHSGGGHYYFDLPAGVDLDYGRVGAMKLNGYDVRWGLSQTLVPPSRRPEGVYRASGGDIVDCPEWLLEKIRAHIDRVVERRIERAAMTANDAVAQWSIATPWDSLLGRHGWTPTGKTDRCSCAIWTRPGGGSTSYKSATAHEADCTMYALVEGHGPLHMWSTEVGGPLQRFIEAGQQTITKLQFVAAMEYADDTSAAQVGLGIAPDFSTWDLPRADDKADAAEPEPTPEPEKPASDQEMRQELEKELLGRGIPADKLTVALNIATTEIVRATAREVAQSWRRHSQSDVDSWLTDGDFVSKFLSGVVEPPPGLLRRVDGKGLWYAGRTHLLSGRRGSGKTMLALHGCAEVLADGGSVMYIDLEDQPQAWRERLKIMGCPIDDYVSSGQAVWRKPDGFPLRAVPRMVEAFSRYDLVVFDVLNRLIARMGGDPGFGNAESLWLTDNLFDPLAATGTCVVVLDHPNRKGQRAGASDDELEPGGGSMKMNSLTGQGLGLRAVDQFSRGKYGGKIRLISLKDRPGYHEEMTDCGLFVGRQEIVDSRLVMLTSIEMPDPHAGEDLGAMQSRVLDYVREKPTGTRFSNTKLLGAAGDKNGTHGEQRAIDGLVTDKILLRFEKRGVADKIIVDYEYVGDDPTDGDTE